LLEFKTHGESSFISLAGSSTEWRKFLAKDGTVFPGSGVRQANFTHYVQMQIYLHGFKLLRALYCAVNKNTDDLYIEEVLYDRETAEQFIDRAQMIVDAKEPPPKLNTSPGFYKCKLCNQNAVCHQDRLVARTCRSCHHVAIGDEGTWGCRKHRKELSTDEQLAACGDYVKAFGGEIPF
jgi:hypothetical protein